MSYEPPRADPRVDQPEKYGNIYPSEGPSDAEIIDNEPGRRLDVPVPDDGAPKYNVLNTAPGYQLTYGVSRRKRPLLVGIAVFLVVGVLVIAVVLMPALGLSNGLVDAWFNNAGTDRSTLDAPEPLLPGDGSEVEGVSVTLYWAPVKGAEQYSLIINRSTGGPINVTTVDAYYTLAPLSDGASYSWTVTPMADGRYGPASDTFSFTANTQLSVPVLTTPMNGTVIVNELPSLGWSAVAGADGYRVQMAGDASFSRLFLDVTTASNLYLPSLWLPHGTTCHWRVMAEGSLISGGWSAARCFTYTVEVTVPIPLSPSPAATVLGTSTELTWSPVTGAQAYRVQVSTSSTFADLMVDVTSPGDSYELEGPLQQDTTYYWRVQAGQDGAWSPWCNVQQFYVGLDSLPISYSWSYGGTAWTLTETITGASYYSYHDRARTYDYASYVTDDDPMVVAIASELKDVADDRGYNAALFILSFVQNVPYTDDDVTTGRAEYPRYPVETLVDGGGDCEDKSALFASLMQASPVHIDVVLLEFHKPGAAGHMAVGVYAIGAAGQFYTYQSRDYYYTETTGVGWSIGQMPSSMEGYACIVLPC